MNVLPNKMIVTKNQQPAKIHKEVSLVTVNQE